MHTVESIRAAITPVCRKYQVRRVFLFGSYAKGTANEQSDVDLFVERGEHSKITGLFSLAEFERELREALGYPVDVVTHLPDTVASRIFRQELKESEVMLYAA